MHVAIPIAIARYSTVILLRMAISRRDCVWDERGLTRPF